MQKKLSPLSRFLRWADSSAGKPVSFVVAMFFLISWVCVGLIWGYTNTWFLIIIAVATINASLMVFVIQNTQNRMNKALNLKLDGILAGLDKTEKKLIAIEEMEEEEIDLIRNSINKKSK